MRILDAMLPLFMLVAQDPPPEWRQVIAVGSSLTLAWTAPVCAQGSHYDPTRTPPCAPAECVECAVLFYPQRTGDPWWLIAAAPPDTLARLPASDGAPMSYFVPLWVGYGATNVICRDAARNWSLPSNYQESKNP